MNDVVKVAAILAMVSLAVALADAQQPPPAANVFAYEQDTTAAALSAMNELDRQGLLPANVRTWLDRGRQESQLLLTAIAAGDKHGVRQHHRAAMKALAKISRWLLEKAPDNDSTREAREQRLRTRLQILFQRLSTLETSALQLDAPDLLEEPQQLAIAAKVAIDGGNLDATRDALRQLQTALDDGEAALGDVVAEREDSQP